MLKNNQITEMQLVHRKYRPDIDGLRAIAVLFVVGYHAFPTRIKGGFIGVDIFFVISGFLISTIIFENLRRDSFSFIEFYSRRIKRIFPALIIILTACLVFGWFVLLADEYKQLGKHIAGGAGFISNIILWRESGYFDNAAEFKTLLHLWSLGIEEQFYIVWPLLVWVAWKQKLNWLTITIAIVVTSFIISIRGIHKDAVAAFYSPQTRFWELLIGSLLSYITLYKNNILTTVRQKLDKWLAPIIYIQAPEASGDTLRNVWSVLGGVAIIIGVLLITKEKHFPGTWALLPTLGAVLLISAGPKAWFNRTILANRVLVWIGLISFPLYLWHWPILSFTRIIKIEALSIKIRITAILVSILLAWLTYVLIEKPMRSTKYTKIKVIVLLIFMGVVGYAGYNVYDRNGLDFKNKDRREFTNYFENDIPEWKSYTREHIFERYRDDCNFYNLDMYRINKATTIPIKEINQSCYTRNLEKPKSIFIWGDSHAQQLYYGLNKNLPSDWQVLQVASSGCSADANKSLNPEADYCQKSNEFALNAIKLAKPQIVIVAQNLGHDAIKSKEIAEKLKDIGIEHIIFTGPVPHWQEDLPKIIVRKLWFLTPERTFIGLDKELLHTNDDLKIKFKENNLTYVDLISFFCNKDGCLTRIGDDRMRGITTYDYGHLLPVASDYLAKNLLVPKIIEITSVDKPRT